MATGAQQAQPRSLYEFGEAWMLQSVAQARGSAVAPAVLLSSSAHCAHAARLISDCARADGLIGYQPAGYLQESCMASLSRCHLSLE
jgi:hypothetical protein